MMLQARKPNDGADHVIPPSRWGRARRGLNAPKTLLLCLLTSRLYLSLPQWRQIYFPDAGKSGCSNSPTVHHRDVRPRLAGTFVETRMGCVSSRVLCGPAGTRHCHPASPQLFLATRTGRGARGNCFVAYTGALSCTGMYRSESRARGKSNDRKRHGLTELSVRRCSAPSQNSFGPLKLRLSWPPSQIQTSAPPRAGSPVRSSRRPALQQPCSPRSFLRGAESSRGGVEGHARRGLTSRVAVAQGLERARSYDGVVPEKLTAKSLS